MSPRVVADALPLPGVEKELAGRPSRWLVLGRLLVAVVAAGALLAGFFLPWLVGAARGTDLAAGVLRPVGGDLLDATPAGNTRVLAADGSLIAEFYRRNRTVVASEDIAPVMKMALVAIEDGRFYEHPGVDGKGLARAFMSNLAAGTVVQGGSTLSQQLVKQIRLQTATAADERRAATAETLGRKLREAQLALALEERYSKDAILTRYLNRVYFGAGAYGVHAAAETFFDTTPDALTLPQAALLAGLVQSPASYDPFVAPDRATARRDVVIGRMLELGLVDEVAAGEARSAPVTLQPGEGPPRGCREAVIGGFFCDYVLSYLTGTLGISRELIETGGLTVETTLDPVVQTWGDAAVRGSLPPEDPRAGIYTVVQPGTGRVLAMSVNRDFGEASGDPTRTAVNLPVVAAAGAGSTYKVFTAAAALEAGFGLRHEITTEEPYESTVYRDGTEPYTVENVGTLPATLDMEAALARSSNTYFLALEDQLGSVAGPVDMALRLGLTSLEPVADQVVAENRGSFTFGAEATSPLALTNAYATLAASGTRCQTSPVDRVRDRHGEPILGEDGTPLGPGTCTPEAVPAGLANTLTQALRKDVEPGFPGQTGARAYVPGHQIAGKTGTAQDNYSIAFVGYTPEFAAGVMVYDPVTNRDVGTFGGGLGAQIWHDALAAILTARPPVPFPPADARYVGSPRPAPVALLGGPTAIPDSGAGPDAAEPGPAAPPSPASDSAPARPPAPPSSPPPSTPAPPPSTPAPEPTPTPPSPSPAPEPVPASERSPEPESTPAPESSPEPTPAPAPSPDPEPSPEPTPSPESTPAPESSPESAPEPGSETEPGSPPGDVVGAGGRS